MSHAHSIARTLLAIPSFTRELQFLNPSSSHSCLKNRRLHSPLRYICQHIGNILFIYPSSHSPAPASPWICTPDSFYGSPHLKQQPPLIYLTFLTLNQLMPSILTPSAFDPPMRRVPFTEKLKKHDVLRAALGVEFRLVSKISRRFAAHYHNYFNLFSPKSNLKPIPNFIFIISEDRIKVSQRNSLHKHSKTAKALVPFICITLHSLISHRS